MMILSMNNVLLFFCRRKLVEGADFTPTIHEMIEKFISDTLPNFCPEKSVVDDWDVKELKEFLHNMFGTDHDFQIDAYLEQDGVSTEDFKNYLVTKFQELHQAHISSWEPSIVQDIQREYVLRPLDFHWRQHLAFLDRLGKLIGFRGYGQKDPLIEYKREAFESFANFLNRWRTESLSRLMQLQVRYAEPEEAEQNTSEDDFDFSNVTHPETGEAIDLEDYPRNADCPCGSGKKFKHCHGHPAVLKELRAKNVNVAS